MRLLSMQIDAEMRARVSKAIAEHLLTHLEARLHAVQLPGMAIFKSFADEVDLSYFESELIVRKIPYQILTEATSLSLLPDYLIVPGMAFDPSGRRLGRGKGYYDRLLVDLKLRSPQMISIGVAYDHQLVKVVPTEAHDHVVDMICLPSLGLFHRTQE